MNKNRIYSIFFSLLFVVEILSYSTVFADNMPDCPIDILSDPLIGDKLNAVINARSVVRENIKNNTIRDNRNLLSVPVVFHNLHRQSERSFCDYISGFGSNGNYDTTK